jgi:hypothetical protein
MGEIADDMIDGSSCSLCGQYFRDLKELATALASFADENNVSV